MKNTEYTHEQMLDWARKDLMWVKESDKDDKEGRYWISAYRGAVKTLLIVKDGRIIGSAEGSCPCILTWDVWMPLLKEAIEEKVSGEYHLIPADGSGCYFYLRNREDAKYLETREYDVPDAQHGGLHHNVEVK